jgi:hypothetical protein
MQTRNHIKRFLLSTQSNLLGIGPYSPEIADSLLYQKDAYIGLESGTLVLTSLFQCNTKIGTEDLASAVGITDLWDFAQHPVDKDKLKWKELDEINDEDSAALSALLVKGFYFIFHLDA